MKTMSLWVGTDPRLKMNKYAIYERVKKEIERTAKSYEEYQRRIKALASKLKI